MGVSSLIKKGGQGDEANKRPARQSGAFAKIALRAIS